MKFEQIIHSCRAFCSTMNDDIKLTTNILNLSKPKSLFTIKLAMRIDKIN